MITVRYSTSNLPVDMGGRTIREIYEALKDAMLIPAGVECRVSAGVGQAPVVMNFDQSVKEGAYLEFVKSQGEKGGNYFFVPDVQLSYLAYRRLIRAVLAA